MTVIQLGTKEAMSLDSFVGRLREQEDESFLLAGGECETNVAPRHEAAAIGWIDNSVIIDRRDRNWEDFLAKGSTKTCW